MELWIEPETGSYGLRPQVEYGDTTGKTLEFNVAGNLRFEVNAEDLDDRGIARILFWPDGVIDEESLEDLNIWRNGEEKITIAQAEFGLGYIVEEETE